MKALEALKSTRTWSVSALEELEKELETTDSTEYQNYQNFLIDTKTKYFDERYVKRHKKSQAQILDELIAAVKGKSAWMYNDIVIRTHNYDLKFLDDDEWRQTSKDEQAIKEIGKKLISNPLNAFLGLGKENAHGKNFDPHKVKINKKKQVSTPISKSQETTKNLEQFDEKDYYAHFYTAASNHYKELKKASKTNGNDTNEKFWKDKLGQLEQKHDNRPTANLDYYFTT